MTNFSIVLTPTANQNLTAILDYIAIDLASPLTSNQTRHRLIKGLEKLSIMPEGYPHIKQRIDTIHSEHDLQYFQPYKKYFAIFYVDEPSKTVFITILSQVKNQNTTFELFFVNSRR